MRILIALPILLHSLALAGLAQNRLACAPSVSVTKDNTTVQLRAWSDGPAGSLQYAWKVDPPGTVTPGAEGAATWQIGNADDGPLTATVTLQQPGSSPQSCVVHLRVAHEFGAPSRGNGRAAFHAFLTPNTPELPGLGQYSYLIFGKAPSDADKPKYLKILRELLDRVPATAELANGQPAQVNGLFIPLHTAPKDAETFGDAEVAQLLAQYDYTKAKSLLAALRAKGQNLDSDGIYLVSASGSLSNPATQRPFLIVNLSLMPADLAPTWVGTFVTVAQNDQYTNPHNMDILLLDLRLSLKLLAVNVPRVEDAVSKWVKKG